MSDFLTRKGKSNANGTNETVIELPGRGKKPQAFIRAAKDCDSSYLWLVVGRQGEMYFQTLREAKAYCKAQGWL